METTKQTLVSAKAIIFDILLSIGFFGYMAWVCRSHVFIEQEPILTILACFTALCVTGVFWIGIQYFRVTLTDQRKRRKQQ